MPFGVVNALALLQELKDRTPYILRRRSLIQKLVSCGAKKEAHIDVGSLGTSTQEDHILLLQSFSLSVRKTISASNSRKISLCVRG